ncbi:ABC transporter permease [Pseudochelatococcus contaminans]|uniref:Peptide/nickel transport system permease protein n=1 Tax=Pseudochelatococcus contaminans TaxID=1538103 RepID=A0A7W5Z2G0_9HYPH|nr:ABC transporter permease [Pseudochelatococcus contaminans]MBB3808883.1 peptide/nickel transport system permease protein [Pseudochelatococcus contaminans]
MNRDFLNARLLAGAIIVGGVCLMALISLVWTPYDPLKLDIANRFAPPGPRHWLGTDQLGRDVLSLLMRGAVGPVGVSISAVTIGLVVGATAGMLAASSGGVASYATLRTSDFLFAFPALLIAILLRETLGPGMLNAMVAIGIFYIPIFIRVSYGASLPVWRSGYVAAARVAGRGSLWIATVHVLPNIAGVLTVHTSVQLSLGVLAEASLSYIGLGVQPPQPSWGRMLLEAQTLLPISPLLAIAPGLAIMVTVMGFNLLGAGLRQALDPRGAFIPESEAVR